ncbi:MAG: RNA polymerase sigma factor [Actinobacteria bacterium]|nr:RNA polymerase sigma factor [Actinomycetota bacterium]
MARRAMTPRLASRRPLAALADEQLVVLFRRGNESAFEELFDRHSAGVLSFCSRFLCSQQDGEDAHQRAFLAVYRAISERGFEPRAFKPWLYTIARNRCLTVRRSGREGALSGGEESVPAAWQTVDRVERQAEVRELVSDVRDLPEEQRAAILLSEVCGLSHTEVGQIVGCPCEKVKSLVFQARASLSLSRAARETPCGRVREELAAACGSRLPLALRRHLSGARRKFRRVEGGAGWLTNVMAWDDWRQRSSSMPRPVLSSSDVRRA